MDSVDDIARVVEVEKVWADRCMSKLGALGLAFHLSNCWATMFDHVVFGVRDYEESEAYSRRQVDEFYKAALAAGAKGHGATTWRISTHRPYRRRELRRVCSASGGTTRSGESAPDRLAARAPIVVAPRARWVASRRHWVFGRSRGFPGSVSRRRGLAPS